jgi:replicative DNA helicase
MEKDLAGMKPYLQDYASRTLEKSKSGLYNCPLCGSGTGPNRSGALGIFDEGQRWKCQSCQKGGDIFDLYAAVNSCSLSEATKAIIGLYGDAPARPPAQQPPAPTRSLTADIERYAGQLADSPGETYFTGRGLTLDTMRKERLGYSPEEYNKLLQKRLPSIVIPYPGTDYYITRPITEKAYDKPKGIPEPLYNAAALYSGAAAVFIVESQLCAISIEQEGGAAVALGGGGESRLLQQLKDKPTSAALILCLDNDKPGTPARDNVAALVAKLGEALPKLGAFVVNGAAAIMGDSTDGPKYRKDPNEVLQKSGADTLKAAVYETIQETINARQAAKQAAEAERQERTGAGMVDRFLEAIQTRKYEPMPTGITDIDRAIGGGFIRQQLVLLGAAPGAGKTALAQWIFEGMAKHGTACIYLNLEMAQEQLLARSISRIAAQQGATIKSTDILQGYKWTAQQRGQVVNAAAVYREEIAPRMIYNPQETTANLDSILEYIGQEAQRAEAAGDQAPVCVLDYLQLVSGDNRDDAASVIKRAVAGLKAYAVKHNTLVFVIIAHNRESNKSGAVTMEAGRDTSALEYSADLQFALTYTLCLKRDGKKGKAPDDLTEDEKRQVTLKITKGRFGGGGKGVDLYFNGETMTYTQTTQDFTPVNDDDIDGVRI